MKRVKISIILLALVLLFSACGKKGDPSAPAGDDMAGTVRLAMRTPTSLNPIEAPWESCKNTFLLIYDGLFRDGGDMEVVPQLAESYSVLSEGMEVMIYLRTDVFWHDGTPFTAKDVIHTFETIRNTENAAYASNIEKIISWKQIDDYTVNIFLSEPYGTVVHELDFPIIPAHFNDYENGAVGTGAFRLSAYEPQKSMTLTANESYFGGAPKMNGVQVAFVRTDDMTAAAFSSRSIDLVPVSLQESGMLSLEENMQYVSYPSTRLVFLGMNTNRPLFASALTRRAISSLMDRESIVTKDYQGKAVASTGTIHPKSKEYNAEISDWEYSLDSARESLFAAGWSDLNGDGIIELSTAGEESSGNENRPDFICTILTNEEDVLRVLVANRLASAMNEVGISATVEALPYETYLQRIHEGNYDCYLGKVELKSTYDVGFLLNSGGEGNFTGYQSEAVDRVITAMMRAEDDLSAKVSADDYQKVFAEEWPIVPICFLDSGWYAWEDGSFFVEGYRNPYQCSHLWEMN